MVRAALAGERTCDGDDAQKVRDKEKNGSPYLYRWQADNFREKIQEKQPFELSVLSQLS